MKRTFYILANDLYTVTIFLEVNFKTSYRAFAHVTYEEANFPLILWCPAISTAVQSSGLKSHHLCAHLQQNHSTLTSGRKQKLYQKTPNRHTSSSVLPSVFWRKTKGMSFSPESLPLLPVLWISFSPLLVSSFIQLMLFLVLAIQSLSDNWLISTGI